MLEEVGVDRTVGHGDIGQHPVAELHQFDFQPRLARLGDRQFGGAVGHGRNQADAQRLVGGQRRGGAGQPQGGRGGATRQNEEQGVQ